MDSDFVNNIGVNRQLVDVHLDSAENRGRSREAFLKQYYSFGKHEVILLNDSVNEKNFLPVSSIAHSIKVFERSFAYYDGLPSDGFYQKIYVDSQATLDSTYYKGIANKVG